MELVTVGNKGSSYFKKRQPGSEGKVTLSLNLALTLTLTPSP